MPDVNIIAETCCGFSMIYQEVFGIRRYQCWYRGHHPAIWVNLNTGERITDDDLSASASDSEC